MNGGSMKKAGNTIFIKICGIFSLLIIILFLFAAVLYAGGKDRVKSQIIKNLALQNRNFAGDLAAEIERLTILQCDLINDWNLTKLTLPESCYSDYEKSQMSMNIWNRIKPIQSSSRLVEDIRVIIPASGTYIGTDMINDIDESMRQLLEEYPQYGKHSVIYRQDQCMIVFAYPVLYYKTDRELKFMLQTTLSTRGINQILKDLNTEGDGSSFLMSAEKDMMIGEEEKAEFNAEICRNLDETASEPYSAADAGTFFQKVKIDGKPYFVVSTYIGLDDIRVVKCVSEKMIFGELAGYGRMMQIFAVLSFGCVLLFAFYIRRQIHQPLRQLMEGFKEVKEGNVKISIQYGKKDEFKYIYDDFNDMAGRLNELINQRYAQEILLQKSELRQLQAQINPHFLYNSFLILSNRINDEDIEFATDFCRQLGSFFRFITKNKNGLITLKEEMEHAVIYCRIQYARFCTRMDMDIQELPEEYEGIRVPRLILQPLLENEFRHSLELLDYRGLLRVRFVGEGEFLTIIIEDNGNTVTDVKLEEMKESLTHNEGMEITGMINIHKRLVLAYGEECGLTVARSELGGVRITVRINREEEKLLWKDF